MNTKPAEGWVVVVVGEVKLTASPGERHEAERAARPWPAAGDSQLWGQQLGILGVQEQRVLSVYVDWTSLMQCEAESFKGFSYSQCSS